MKNNLSDLNNHLFSTLEGLDDKEDMDDEKLEKLLKKAKAVCAVSSQILQVGRLQLDAMKIADSCNYMNEEMPALLETRDSGRAIKEQEKEKKKLLGGVL